MIFLSIQRIPDLSCKFEHLQKKIVQKISNIFEKIQFNFFLSGRCVVVIGMPYPNSQGVELRERRKHLEGGKRGAGDEYYHNLCFR